MNYISLFSSAGVGCYGFKLEGFECIATNEIIKRRLDIQKFNNKCKYESGYICGDITDEEIKSQLFEQVAIWKKKENVQRVDVLIATPPCQGMSVANHKKNDKEIIRNSLVVESIKIIKEIQPKFFIFENVAAFMKTICTDIDGVNKPISEAIKNNLGSEYSYTSQVINLKNYGACSSRQRTIVIGVSNDYANEISPFELYPSRKEEKTLREVIGHLRPLKKFGEIDENDIYHAFRTYPEHMRDWISGLKEGESAFDNEDDEKKPQQIENGSTKNFAILVPTKALINEVRSNIIGSLQEKLKETNYRVVSASGDIVLHQEHNFIFVMTPERLLHMMIGMPKIKIDFLFVDEAHKISDRGGRSA